MVENHLVGVLSYFRKLLERMGLACRKGSGPPSSSVAIYFYCCRLFSSCSTLRHSFSCHFPPCLNSRGRALICDVMTREREEPTSAAPGEVPSQLLCCQGA